MTDLPEPLTPPECDLRGFDFMPLFGHRLFRSELYEQSTGEEFKIAVKLWWEAWNQCPAGSLPDDDSRLCRLADLGRDLKTWKRMRDAALRGFVLCSDGRLYHKLLCEWALDAFARRVKERERKRKWREGKSPPDGGTDGGQNAPRPRDNRPNGRGQDDDETGTFTATDGDSIRDNGPSPRSRDGQLPFKGQDRTGQDSSKKESKLLNEGSLAHARDPSEPPSPAIVGPDATECVVVGLREGLRIQAYPPGRKPKRSVAEQIAAASPLKTQSGQLTPEQLAEVRLRAGMTRRLA